MYENRFPAGSATETAPHFPPPPFGVEQMSCGQNGAKKKSVELKPKSNRLLFYRLQGERGTGGREVCACETRFTEGCKNKFKCTSKTYQKLNILQSYSCTLSRSLFSLFSSLFLTPVLSNWYVTVECFELVQICAKFWRAAEVATSAGKCRKETSDGTEI